MSKYYLDTDMLSLLERGNNAIQYHLLKRDPSEVFMTVITFHEQIEGRFKMIDKARTPATLALAYEQFAQTLLYLRDLPVATFNEPRYFAIRRPAKNETKCRQKRFTDCGDCLRGKWHCCDQK